MKNYLSQPLARRLAEFKRTATAGAYYTDADGKRLPVPDLRGPSAGGEEYANHTFKHGTGPLLWVESPGLRRVGFADEVAKSIRHKGWFLDDENQDETARGEVYRLPNRRGFVPAIADPYNDGRSCFLLDVYDAERDCAHAADDAAQRYAEAEQDHQRKERERIDAEEKAEAEKARALSEIAFEECTFSG